jgi:hypothetical protein
MMRYFIGFFATVLLIILLIVLLVRGGGKPKTPTTVKTLDSYATTNSEVSLTTDGPVNANSLHQQVRINVDRDNATYEQFTGYDGQAVKQQQFPNSENAYEAFLLALQQAGFTHGSKIVTQEERGFCPQGDRFVYMLKQDDKVIERYWATSCGTTKSYLGSVSLTNELFKAQIPGYNQLTQDARL